MENVDFTHRNSINPDFLSEERKKTIKISIPRVAAPYNTGSGRPGERWSRIFFADRSQFYSHDTTEMAD